ncbi:hypothetical protein Dimus_032132 [Dionaea muscipula]
MAPTRRQSNGRSPLVNPQRQITTFFSKSSPSQSPAPSHSPSKSEQNPNPSPTLKRSFFGTNPNPSPSSKPTTPSPLNPKSTPKITKPLLVIGAEPSPSPNGASKRLYGEEVVGRKVRVCWPLDEEWYEGYVKSFDKLCGKHLVEYDDKEEELLDLTEEKVEWVEGSVNKFKRLRRMSMLEDDEEEEKLLDLAEEKVEWLEGSTKKFKRLRRMLMVEDDDEGGNGGGGDDSEDEDWGKNVEDMVVDDCLVDEDDEMKWRLRRKSVGSSGDGKWKASEAENVSSNKKRTGVTVDSSGDKMVETATNGQLAENVIKSDALERFGNREAEKFPFLGKNRRDANKRRPEDANYDPKTLFLPPEFLKGLSSGQRQWWEFKSKHMDKVIFFKMGKFYELFEMDAHVGVKELDLQYMKGEQPHCGFPERNFSMNLEKLARKQGYRVLVVEQTETPEQLETRRREEGSKDKVVRREVCAIVTKGTLTEGEMLSANPDASYVMAVAESCPVSLDHKEERTYGICVVDIATSRIIIGQIKDDAECNALCCLLSELRPVEIIKPAKSLSLETEKVLARCTRNPLVNDLIPGLEFWDADKTLYEVKRFYSRANNQSDSSSFEQVHVKATDSAVEGGLGCLPAVLNELVKIHDDGKIALSSFGGTLFYLRQAFLDETLLRYAKFEKLPCTGFRDVFQKHHMVLDAAALENLEIFENSKNGGSAGTLYAQLNHCVTASGKRMLKTWLARPLYNLEAIKARQDAIAGLRENNFSSSLEFRKELSKLPDMERLLTRLFASCDANGRNANKIILYEDAAKKQLQEFISTLRGCELMAQACSHLGSITNNVNSVPLQNLLVPGKSLPEISSILDYFREAFDWVEANNSGRIIPREGADMEYDSACQNIKEIESSLIKHLKEQKKLLKDTSIKYVTVGKDSYLLEVPESLRGSVPRDYELRSSKKGFFRYWTPDIKKTLGELLKAESEKESKLKCILQRLIGRFCEHHKEWRQLVSTVAELDVLISLAIAREYYEGPSCQPIISIGDNMPYLSAKSLGHPLLRSDSFSKGAFVPNSITIGGSDNASFILLTGPNMGGKSTLLRQVCLAVILAQVGADVPAEHFELSLVDRIFVRMGAKDQIIAGQSTFLMELSETASMLTCATRESLVALDELGRGTSTSDGQAIAGSVLEYFVGEVQCRGMFSTHYHHLAIDFKADFKVVSLCHMACRVGKGVGGVEEVTFLYKLTPGACPKSYGVNVARIAGIPESVLEEAALKSREFEAAYGRKNEVVKHGGPQILVEETFPLIVKKLIGVIANLVSSSSTPSAAIKLLVECQEQARILLK